MGFYTINMHEYAILYPTIAEYCKESRTDAVYKIININSDL